MGLQTGIRRIPGCFRRQQLRHVGLGATRLSGLEQPGRLLRHQGRGLGCRERLGDRELHALVLPDRAAEHFPVVGVIRRLLDEPAGISDTLMRDQDALRVHAVEDITEAFAFLTDQILGGHFEIVEEDFRRRMIDHRADRPNFQPVTLRLAHIDDEDGQAVGAFLHLVLRRGPGEQQHQVGMLCARGPDLLTIHDIFVIALFHRRGGEGKRIGAAGRLRHPESLQAQLPAGDLRQIFFLLLLVPVPEQAAHDVHLGMAGAAIAAGFVDFLEDRRRRADGQPAAAIFLRDQDREIAGLGQCLDEFRRIGALPVFLPPILPWKIRAKRLNGTPDLGDNIAVRTHMSSRCGSWVRPQSGFSLLSG